MSIKEKVEVNERQKAESGAALDQWGKDWDRKNAEANRLNLERAERIGRPFFEELNAELLNNAGTITVEAIQAAGRCQIVWPHPGGYDRKMILDVNDDSITVRDQAGDDYGTVKLSEEKWKDEVEKLIAGGYCGTITAHSRD